MLAGALLVLGRKLQTIDDLKTGYKEISQDIKLLIDRIGRLEGKMEGVVAGGSPLQPTELGAKYIKESGLEEIFKDKGEEFKSGIKKLLPTSYTDYDVQETARRVLFAVKNEPWMRSVKQYAFDNALEVETILSAGALWLRDDFIDRPRGISKTSKVPPPLSDG